MLGLARPDQLRVQVGIISVGLLAAVLIRIRSYQTHRRIIHPLLVLMPVGINLLLPPALLAWSHGMCLCFDVVVLILLDYLIDLRKLGLDILHTS